MLFGATGDLSRRKLIPGLAHLALSALAPDIQVIGTSLEDHDEEQFRAFAKQAVTEFSHHPLTEEQWDDVRPAAHLRAAVRRTRRAWPRRSSSPRRSSAARSVGCTT